MDNEVELTELYDLEVERHDGVANPASGFSFLVTKAVAAPMDMDGDGSNDMDDQGIFGCEPGCPCECHAGDIGKAKLTAAARNSLPDSDFALPGRKYPIHDATHARDALSRVAENGTPEEKAKVRAAVKRRYPGINVGKGDMDENSNTETSEAEVEKESTETPAAPAASVETVQELIKAALAERDSEAEKRVAKAEAEVAELKSALDVLKATPIPGGPVLSATAEQRMVKAKSEAAEKARYHRRMADATSNDRELAAFHVAKAEAFEAEAK